MTAPAGSAPVGTSPSIAGLMSLAITRPRGPAAVAAARATAPVPLATSITVWPTSTWAARTSRAAEGSKMVGSR
jgi:hypothetical protein